MRFFGKRTSQSVGIEPSPDFVPPNLNLDRPPLTVQKGFSVTIKHPGQDPTTHDHLVSYSVSRDVLILRLSDRTNFYFPLVNIEWFSATQEGEL